MKTIEAFSPLFGGGYGLHPETLSLQERHWKSGIPSMDQDSITFHLRKGFVRERNWIEGYFHDKWLSQFESDSAMSQLLLFVLFLVVRARLDR